MKKSDCKLMILLFITYNSFSQLHNNKVIIEQNMSQKWELDSIDKKGTFRLVSYRPIYFSAARWSSKKNERPFKESGEFATK